MALIGLYYWCLWS